VINLDLSQIRAAAQAMNCDCEGKCKRGEALSCLYAKTLDLLSSRDDNPAARVDLLRPLAMVTGYQKSRAGQRECAAYAATLAAGDAAGALAACQRLIDLENNRT
jgi:hypothetical protein